MTMNAVELKNSSIATRAPYDKLAQEWQPVCRIDDIVPDTGVCVLFQGEQVAIFRARGSDQLFAISNYDPIGGANVLSRGILGSLEDELVVASPLYKQHFSLRTGSCIEDDNVGVKTYAVRECDGQVFIA